VVGLHDRDGAPRACGWHAEAIALALDDEDRDGDSVELRQAASARRPALPLRRLEREGQAEHGVGSGPGRGAAGDARSGGASADDSGSTDETGGTEVLDHRGPRRIELVGRGGRPSPGDAVGLLDEGGREPERVGDPRRRDEVASAHAAAGTVAEHEDAARFVGGLAVDARRPVLRGHVDRQRVS
jgi:hypothetical protein